MAKKFDTSKLGTSKLGRKKVNARNLPRKVGSRIRDVKKGQKFGSWTVLKDGTEVINHTFKAYCKCSCGRESHVDVYKMTAGDSKRCANCAAKKGRRKVTKRVRQIDTFANQLKIGDVFGSRMIIGKPIKRVDGWYVHMACKCGVKSHVKVSNVAARKSLSCVACSVKDRRSFYSGYRVSPLSDFAHLKESDLGVSPPKRTSFVMWALVLGFLANSVAVYWLIALFFTK